ncbi:MAG: hypothetical protein WC539_05925 [Nitrospirota bacterium]
MQTQPMSAPSLTNGIASRPVVSLPTGTVNPEKNQGTIEPLSIKPLVAIEPGRNDANPVWSPQGNLIAFERSIGDKKEIIITRPDGTLIQTIYVQASELRNEMKFFFPGVYEETSYNAGISWSPTGNRVVFMSNGGEGDYNLYMREISSAATTTTRQLTNYKEKNGHAHWSPVSENIVFVSGRTGKGDLYILNGATLRLTRLTTGEKPYLYPQWSPDGKKIAMIHGSNENHDIYVITDVAKPKETLKPLTSWEWDDLRPVWSPDGTKIAFYSNVSDHKEAPMWSLLVISSDGTDSLSGPGLSAKIIARDVVPDMERGPAWMPDSARIVYVKNDRQGYNPIHLADIRDKGSSLIRTNTKMNHDISCSSDGAIAFRAQVNQWDHIFVMKLKQ